MESRLNSHISFNTNTDVFYYPENFFENFKVHFAGGYNDKSYCAIANITSENTKIELPQFDFQVINNNSVSEFEVTSEGDYDYHKIQFGYGKRLGNTYNVTWSFYGQKNDLIKVLMPNIKEKIFTKHPEFELSNLENSTIALRRYTGIQSYQEFIGNVNRLEKDIQFELEFLDSFEEVSKYNF